MDQGVHLGTSFEDLLKGSVLEPPVAPGFSIRKVEGNVPGLRPVAPSQTISKIEAIRGPMSAIPDSNHVFSADDGSGDAVNAETTPAVFRTVQVLKERTADTPKAKTTTPAKKKKKKKRIIRKMLKTLVYKYPTDAIYPQSKDMRHNILQKMNIGHISPQSKDVHDDIVRKHPTKADFHNDIISGDATKRTIQKMPTNLIYKHLSKPMFTTPINRYSTDAIYPQSKDMRHDLLQKMNIGHISPQSKDVHNDIVGKYPAKGIYPQSKNMHDDIIRKMPANLVYKYSTNAIYPQPKDIHDDMIFDDSVASLVDVFTEDSSSPPQNLRSPRPDSHYSFQNSSLTHQNTAWPPLVNRSRTSNHRGLWTSTKTSKAIERYYATAVSRRWQLLNLTY